MDSRRIVEIWFWQLNRAADLYGRVVADLEWAFGADHPDTQDMRDNLALARERKLRHLVERAVANRRQRER